MAMAKVLNQERFLPPRLPGLSLWLDAQATTTISSTAAGVTSWADRSEMGNTMNATTFYVPGCTLWLDAADPNATGIPATNGASITTWKDKSGLGCNATGTGTDLAWKLRAPNKQWYGVAMSKDGKNLAACGTGDAGIQISTNYGDSWTPTAAGNATWKSIAISSDGTKLVAGAWPGGLYTSSNSGASWTPVTNNNVPTNAIWYSAASSSSGNIVAAATAGSSGKIYISRDSGVSWNAAINGVPNTNDWNCVTITPNGNILAACSYTGNGSGIYTSTDSGSNWSLKLSGQEFTSVAISDDGTKLAAVILGQGVRISTNSGGSWTTGGLLNARWRSIACSSDGNTLVAAIASNAGGVYLSKDSGISWTPQSTGVTSSIWSIAMSSDGRSAAIAPLGGNIAIGYPIVPSIISTGLNGRPTMNFNGTQWFAGSTVNTGPTMTAFVVMQHPIVQTASFIRFLSMAPATTLDQNAGGILAELTTGTNLVVANGNADSGFSQPNNTPYIMGFQANGTNLISYLNGTAQPGTASTTNFNITRYRVGAMVGNDTNVYTGKISEVIVFTTALSTFERQQVETYLSQKWGIPLPYSVPNSLLISSPVSSSVPVISKTLTNQPSIFFPPGAQMVSSLNSGLGAPTIPGGVVWMDAADTTTYTTGSAITSWASKGAVSGTSGSRSRGTFSSTSINGLPAIAVSAGAEMFIGPRIPFQTTIRSIFLVVTMGAAVAGSKIYFTYGAGISPIFGSLNGSLELDVFDTEVLVASSPTNFFSKTSVVAVTSGIYVNGTSQTLSTNNPVTAFLIGTAATLRLGFLNSTAGYTLGELIIFDGLLTDTHRQTVEGYLATKWGLQANLPPSHPYYSVPYTGRFILNPSGPVSKSLFMAYQCPQTSSRMRFAIGRDVSGQAFGLAQSNGVVYSPYQYGYGDTKWSVTPNTYIVPTLASAVFDAGATMIRGDHAFNSFLDVRETALLNIIPDTPYVLGTSLSASSVFVSASFHVCEIIAYNRALATTDRQMIEGYLAWKWGMTTQLPNGHPYQKFPPTGEQVIVASTPSNLYSGLVSWLDMADSTTYTLSGNTTILKTLTDKAGGGGFTISGNVSISTLGSLPSLSFEGNNSATLQRGGFLSKTLTVPPRGCAFAVFTPASEQLGAEKLGLLGWGSPGNTLNNPALGYTNQSSTTLRLYNPIAANPPFYGPSISLAVSKPAILFWAWYNGNMVYLASNGNAVLSSPQTTGLFNPASTNNIFYIGNDGGFGAKFNLGELCVYNDYLETPFRNILEGYLAWKWGVQSNLPSVHPYALSAPTLQSLTEVNALSQPTDISGLTMWLDAADTTTIQQINPPVTLTGSPTLLGVFSDGYMYYAFKANGTITSPTPLGIKYFAVGGGGGGAFDYGAGGGAGGLQTNTGVFAQPSQVSTIRPLVPGATYSITIGAGGAYQSRGDAPYQGGPGGNTTFIGPGISVTANGGGGGGQGNFGNGQGGGCGGGGGYPNTVATTGGIGTQGGNGNTGVGGYWGGAGGGIGGNATNGGPTPRNGGMGILFSNGTVYGGGGGGAAYSGNAVGLGGSGVGGTGGYGNFNSTTGFLLGIPPVANSGGGGAGGGGSGTGTAGAAGIFILGIPVTQTVLIDKSPISNSLCSSGITPLTISSFGPPARPSIYFGPDTSATSIYNSGADSKQFSAFLVASIPTLSYLLISTGQLTTGTTGAAGQTFGFYASNGVSSVFSPYVVQGSGASNNTVGNYSVISGRTFELFASICGTAVSGNMNFATPLSNVNNTANNITATPWVFGNCTGDTLAKSFHVHEFITYSRPVTAGERQAIEGYLYWKWMV